MTAVRTPETIPARQVDVADALTWLPTVAGRGAVVTSPPDAAEIGARDMARYRLWFMDVVAACLKASTGPTIFIVTDRKADGRWISKAAPIQFMAGGDTLLWHRIALRRGLGQIDLHRPTYTHVLCFGPGRPGKPRPDVIPADTRLWRNGTPVEVADFIAEYLAEVGVKTLVDPFCGTGALLAAANRAGLDALGCDLDPGRAAEALKL